MEPVDNTKLIQEQLLRLHNDQSNAEEVVRIHEEIRTLLCQYDMAYFNISIPNCPKELNKFTRNITVALEKLTNAINSKQEVSDLKILNKASDGLHFCGVSYDKKRDLWERKRQLLKMKDEISVCMTESTFQHLQTHMSYKTEEDCNRIASNTEILGVNPVFLGESSCAFSNDNLMDRTENLDSTDDKILILEKTCTVSMKSMNLTADQVILTEHALERLSNIDFLLCCGFNNHFVLRECLYFLREFGEYVNFGKLEFGGAFRWKAMYNSETIARDQYNKFSKLIQASNSFKSKDLINFASLSKEDIAEVTESEQTNTRFEVTNTGGPRDVNIFNLWKYGLHFCKDTWVLVHRGNFVEIWNVLQNFGNAFKNVDNLADTLKMSSSKTGLEPLEFEYDYDFTNKLVSLLRDIDGFQSWCDSNKCFELIQNLIVLLEKCTDDEISLSGCVMECPVLLKFFDIVKKNDQSTKPFGQWVDLVKFLSNAKTYLLHENECFDDILTQNFGSDCQKFITRLLEGNEYIFNMFFMSVLIQFGYNISNNTFQKPLNKGNVDVITEKVTHYFEHCHFEKDINVMIEFIDRVTECLNKIKFSEEEIFSKFLHPVYKSQNCNSSLKVLLVQHSYESLSLAQLKLDLERCRDGHYASIYHIPVICENVSKIQEEATKFQRVKKDHVYFHILESLGLLDYFPDLISLHDVMKITPKPASKITLTEIPWLFLKGIIRCDFRTRDQKLSAYLGDLKGESSDMSIDPFNSDNVSLENEDPSDIVHPLDLTVLLLHCCSPCLKQMFVQKMLTCKLAYPLITDKAGCLMLNLWPTTQSTIDDEGVVASASDLNSPIVSFVRFGKPSLSKSRIMNKIISEKDFETFHYSDSSLGSVKRTISSGTIEACWYLQPSCHINYWNLRGDGFQHQKQVEIMLKASSVLVVLIRGEDLECAETIQQLKNRQIDAPNMPLLFAIDYANFLRKEALTQNDKFRHGEYFTDRLDNIVAFNFKDKGFCLSEVCEKLKNHIIESTKDTKPLSPVILKSIQSIKGLVIDEDIEPYVSMKRKAFCLLEMLPTHVTEIKQKVIPLQGEPLLELTKNLKISKRSSELVKDELVNDLLDSIKDQRFKQACFFSSKAHPFMINFLSDLLQLYQCPMKCLIYFKYVKILLDEKSSKLLPGLRQTLKSKWNDFQRLQKNGKQITTDVIVALEKAEQDLVEASFGLEHVFRECSQIYESLFANKSLFPEDYEQFVKKLPKAMASVILSGKSFELMNGDAGYVPLQWISAVFTELQSIVGEQKKILTVSILGIQSSGKSTLLNTMFGAEFMVSAGRCTRGLFLQLLPTHGQKYDYLMIIDTEGIRSPELKDKNVKHDNELSTFVIGLADITIININGENTTELADILGIVVQAFMRMKKVNKENKIRKRCIFVHQNVCAVDAKDKLLSARQHFIQDLNCRTKQAAEEENMYGINLFSDIMHFDMETDVFYFPVLWDGSPPMATVNPEYSYKANSLVESIISRPIPDRFTFYTFKDMITISKDLWEGLLADDFLFSFRNTLEFKAYTDVDSRYLEISFELETFIKNNLQTNVEENLRCNIERMERHELDTVLDPIRETMISKATEKYSQQKNALDDFFKCSDRKDIIIQWRESKFNQLHELFNTLISNFKSYVDDVKRSLIYEIGHNARKADFEEKAYIMIRQLAGNCRGKNLDINTQRKLFEEAWEKEVSQIDINANEATPESISRSINIILCETFPNLNALINKIDKKMALKDYSEMDKLEGSVTNTDVEIQKHVSIKTIFHRITDHGMSNETCVRDTVEFANSVCKEIDLKILHLSQTRDKKYKDTFVKGIFTLINDRIGNHNKNPNEMFTLHKDFTSLLLSHTGKFLKIKLSNLNKIYIKEESLLAKMEAHRMTAWNVFQNLFKKATDDFIAETYFEDILKSKINHFVRQQIPPIIVKEVLEKYDKSKLFLIKCIFTSFAENSSDSFDAFMTYVSSSSTYVDTYLLEDIYEYFRPLTSTPLTSTKYFEIANKHINSIFDVVPEALDKTDRMANSPSEWRDQFRSHILHNLRMTFSEASFNQVMKHMKNIKTFNEIVKKRLCDMKEEVQKQFLGTTEKDVVWSSKHPLLEIKDKLWGCTETCPFCSEPCMISNINHTEEVNHKCWQHRVKGVSGRFSADSGKLSVAFCNIHVANTKMKFYTADGSSEFYKNYKTEYPLWDIPPSQDTCDFWKWFVCEYQDRLEARRGRKMNIPDKWKSITKADALAALEHF